MRLLPPSPLVNNVLYEEITSAGDVEPAWPELLPGCKAVFDLVQAPAGSSATASLSGLLADADLPGAYILQRSAVRMGQVAARDFAVVHWPAVGEDVTAPVSPSRIELPVGTTNTGSVTWTHASPPDSPIYTLSVICITDGTTVTPSGSNLTWSWAVETDKAYVATLTCTSGGFSASATPLGVVVAAQPELSLGSPSPVTIAAGTTTGTITWPAASGGTAPYTYAAVITGDSTGAFTTYISGVSTRDVSLAALTNGQFLQVTMTVTDAAGRTDSSDGYVLVASSAAGTMTPGAFPATQNLASTATTATIEFNAVGGTFTAPVSYVATVVSGPGAASNSGTTATLTGLSPGGATLVRLRATDSNGTPRTADAFALVNVAASAASPLVWQKLVGFDLKAQGTVNFVSGANSITLTSDDGRVFSNVPVNISMGLGSYTTCPDALGASGGWRRLFAATASPTYIRSRMGVPLGVPIGADDDLLVVITGKALNNVSANSFYWQVSPADDLSEDAAAVQGMRLLRSGSSTALYLRAGGSSGAIINQSSSPPCPLDWQDGSTVITETIYYPRRSTRGIVYMSEAGVPGPQADLGQVGTTPASNAVRPGVWGGKNTVYVQHYTANGSANGLGLQYSEMHTITIYRRTLP